MGKLLGRLERRADRVEVAEANQLKVYTARKNSILCEKTRSFERANMGKLNARRGDLVEAEKNLEEAENPKEKE